MSRPHQKTTGTDFTHTIAWLTLALIFIPAATLVSQPALETSKLAALAWSSACIGLSVIAWHRYSKLTIPSLNRVSGWWK